MENKARSERMPADFDYQRVRGVLATRRITQKQLAAASALSASWINQVLAGRRAPGRLTRIEIARGLMRLGLDPAAVLGDELVNTAPSESIEPTDYPPK